MKKLLQGISNFITTILGILTTSMNRILYSSRADKLLLAAFVVAALRQMGVNGHFIGWDPAVNWPWFQPFEAVSGIAMAVLEGVALAYVSRRWRRLKLENWTDWTYWTILAAGQLALLISIIVYVAMYAYAAQRQLTVSEVFTPGWNMFWNVLVAGANVLIALLIGIVDDENNGAMTTEEAEDNAWLYLVDWLKQGPTERRLLPSELAAMAGVQSSTAAYVLNEAARMGMLD